MNTTKRTEISSLGEFGLIEQITKGLTTNNKETIKGTGDDAAILQFDNDEEVLVTTDLLMEGIHFDLTYFPLKNITTESKKSATTKNAFSNLRPRTD